MQYKRDRTNPFPFGTEVPGPPFQPSGFEPARGPGWEGKGVSGHVSPGSFRLLPFGLDMGLSDGPPGSSRETSL